MQDLNDNVLTRRWEERYKRLSETTKRRLEKEKVDRQLKVIKRCRIYPEIGDIFQIVTCDDVKLQGVVVNNHINNINGNDLVVICVMKPTIEAKNALKIGLSSENLLFPPSIVGKEYWSKGFFTNIDKSADKIRVDDYGFYSIGKRKIYDEYGLELKKEPVLLGSYGVATIIGIAMIINKELIIENII